MSDPHHLPLDWQTRLRAYLPRRLEAPPDRPRAATALLVVESGPGGAEIAFMERSRRAGDPWSGQVSFPGGHRDPVDEALERTAAREALEELGIAVGTAVGRLDDLTVQSGPKTIVSPHVFALRERPRFVVDPAEVAHAFLAPIGHLLDPSRGEIHVFEHRGTRREYPGIRFEEHVIWGLTLRSLRNFFAVVGLDHDEL